MGLYFGGLRLNLGRFFRVTGVFLVLIAAGLVLGALRTAHEAGWLNIGQRQLFDLSGWIPSDSVLGAVTTGVLGIPADPRLVEVLGWLLYAVPVLVVFLRPARLAATPRARARTDRHPRGHLDRAPHPACPGRRPERGRAAGPGVAGLRNRRG